jgi:putative transposase
MINTLRQQCPVALMCRVLDVPESGFHAWNIRPPGEREQKNARLAIEILAAHQRTRETYGVKRLHSQLVDQGVQITAYRVRVLRKKLNLRCKQKRKFKVTTYSKHHLSRLGFTGDSIRRFEAFSCKVAPRGLSSSFAQHAQTLFAQYLVLVAHEERRIFQRKIEGYEREGRVIVYLDESGFAHDMPRTHGYAPVGERAHGVKGWHATGRTTKQVMAD